MHVHYDSIYELRLLLWWYATISRFSLLKNVKLFAVEDSNSDFLRILREDISFIVEFSITGKIDFSVGSHSFVGCFDELFRSAFLG